MNNYCLLIFILEKSSTGKSMKQSKQHSNKKHPENIENKIAENNNEKAEMNSKIDKKTKNFKNKSKIKKLNSCPVKFQQQDQNHKKN